MAKRESKGKQILVGENSEKVKSKGIGDKSEKLEEAYGGQRRGSTLQPFFLADRDNLENDRKVGTACHKKEG